MPRSADGSTHRQQIRREVRRPIESWEVPHLERLGGLLRTKRKLTGLTQSEMARLAKLSLWMVSQIELGTRRTRASTLGRIACALVTAQPSPGEPEGVARDLLAAAGPALAPESKYRDRVERRRLRRDKKGRYGPREAAPYPGEEFRRYVLRVNARGELPIRGIRCPYCGSDINRSASELI